MWKSTIYIWVRSRNWGCLVTWFCYQLIAKPGNKTAAVPWPDPYVVWKIHISFFLSCTCRSPVTSSRNIIRSSASQWPLSSVSWGESSISGSGSASSPSSRFWTSSFTFWTIVLDHGRYTSLLQRRQTSPKLKSDWGDVGCDRLICTRIDGTAWGLRASFNSDMLDYAFIINAARFCKLRRALY